MQNIDDYEGAHPLDLLLAQKKRIAKLEAALCDCIARAGIPDPGAACREIIRTAEEAPASADRGHQLTIDGPTTNVAILDMLSAVIDLMEVAERGGQLKGYHSVALNRVKSAYGIFRAGVLPLEPAKG